VEYAQDRTCGVGVLDVGFVLYSQSNIWHCGRSLTGGLIGGPVGAVVAGASGAILARPGGVLGGSRYRCHYHDRYGHLRYHTCR
jgi:hypothetical protein